MNIIIFIVVVFLFVILTPGIVVYLPPKASKLTTSITHGFIFAIIWAIIHKPLWRATSHMGMSFGAEGFEEGAETKKKEDMKKKKPPAPPAKK
jgi:H+/gluconate symporter-like permease